MRVVTQENVIQRNRTIAQLSFFFSIAVLVASFVYGNNLASSNPEVASLFNCGIMPTLFLVILFSVRMANNWIREPLPWQALQNELQGVSNEATLYHFVLMPARHILVSPMGVFLIFTLFQDRPIVVDGDKWQMPGGLLARIFVFMRQENLGNPVLMAETEAEFVEKQINSKIDSAISVQPVICFINPRAKVLVEEEPSVPITHAGADVDFKSLKEYIRSQKNEGRTTLTKEQIEALDDKLIYT